jgi:hypothetical protein
VSEDRLVYDMPASQYHAECDGIVRLSNSIGAKIIDYSPAHAFAAHPLLGASAGRQYSDAFDFGTILHQTLLGGESQIDVLEFSDFRTKAAQIERDESRALGRIPMLSQDMSAISDAADSVRETLHRLGLDLLGHSEVTALWESDGVACRGRLDHVLTRDDGSIVVIDLKTCASARPEIVRAKTVEYGYHSAAAGYIDAVETCVPGALGRASFIDVFVEKTWPHYTLANEVSGKMLELGRSRWARMKLRWAECMASNHWPGYAESICALEPPKWAEYRERDAIEGVEL